MPREPLVNEVEEQLVGYSEAVFNEARTHRYVLVRQWGAPNGRSMVFLMLNPSIADHRVNDPTLVRCMTFARRTGATTLVVVNLFAYRATDPAALRGAADPVGEWNDEFIADHCARGLLPTTSRVAVVAAWGAQVDKPRLQPRAREVEAALNALGVPLWCLGRTGSGEPRHPLMVAASTRFEPYNKLAATRAA